MAEYLVSRAEGAPPTSIALDEFGFSVFFQLWRVRADPFTVLQNGDTLWWTDQKTREVRWELRVANLHRARYTSVQGAYERLRRWFGLFPGDLTDYGDSAATEGWLLAWENELVGAVGVNLPSEFKLGRNGFKRIDYAGARNVGLPVPGRPSPFPVPSLEYVDLLAPPRERAIPAEVRRLVFERDGHRCCRCKSTDGTMHLDHIHPYSKGGPNSVANLQVLCARCNLAKAARVEGDEWIDVPGIASIMTAASHHRMAVPSNPDELTALIGACVASGDNENALEIAWDVSHHDDCNDALTDAVLAGLHDLPTRLQAHLLLLREHSHTTDGENPALGALLEADDDISTRAAALLALNPRLEDPDRLIELARRAQESSDRRICAIGDLVLALYDDDDTNFVERLLSAVDHGDLRVAAAAALQLGQSFEELEDAAEMLTLALRAPDLDVARTAAVELATRFANVGDDEISNQYASIANELQTELLNAHGSHPERHWTASTDPIDNHTILTGIAIGKHDHGAASINAWLSTPEVELWVDDKKTIIRVEAHAATIDDAIRACEFAVQGPVDLQRSTAGSVQPEVPGL